MAGVGNVLSEEIDIYDDLIENDDFEATDFTVEKLNDVETLKSENSSLKVKLLELESQLNVLKRRNDALKMNISILFKTAKLEIARKDLLFNDLTTKYDHLLFKRSKKIGKDSGNLCSASTSHNNHYPVNCKQNENGHISVFKRSEFTFKKVGDELQNLVYSKTFNINDKRSSETIKKDVVIDDKSCSDAINDAHKIFKMVQKRNKTKRISMNRNSDNSHLSANDDNSYFNSNDGKIFDTLDKKESSTNRHGLSVGNFCDSKTKEHVSNKLTKSFDKERSRTSYLNDKKEDQCAERNKELKAESTRRLSTESSCQLSNYGEMKYKEFNERNNAPTKKRGRSRSPSKSRLSNKQERGYKERTKDDKMASRHHDEAHSSKYSENRTRRDSYNRSPHNIFHIKRNKRT